MSMNYFGTDGIRGRMGEGAMSAEFLLRLGWAIGSELRSRGAEHPVVVIGKDTRLSGYLCESALEAGLAAAGANVVLLGPMPTPAVAHLTRNIGGALGVVISASHNPFYDNGVKLFSSQGEKVDDGLQLAIEARLEQPMAHVAPEKLGRASRLDDAVGRYIEYCKATVPYGTRFEGLKVVVDCANGATYRIAPAVFRELGATVISIHDRPDGLNINAACGSTHPQSLITAVREHQADLGLAFDGDGDRVIMVSDQGELINGDRILYVLAKARQANGGLEGGVVGTIMSNFGLEQAFAALGVAFERVPVGDRHVHERLVERGWLLGGEASGHILCLDRSSTGCGIVSGLQVVEVVARSGRPLSALAAGMQVCPQHMINVPTAGGAPHEVVASAVVSNAVAEAEHHLAGAGRVVLRPSGTEPVIRVMVEGEDAEQVKQLTASLAAVVEAACASAV
jgi:phosphoglucosamine mutase